MHSTLFVLGVATLRGHAGEPDQPVPEPGPVSLLPRPEH